MVTKRPSRNAEYWQAYRAAAADPSAGTIILLQPKRVHQTTFAMSLMRELPAVFTVFATAASALQVEHDTAGYALAGAELIAGAGVLVAIALEGRHLFGRHGEHGHAKAHAHAAPHRTSRVDASNLAAAALGYVEAWHRAHVVGHLKLFSPAIVGATASLFLAFFKNRPSAAKHRQRRPMRRLHICIAPAGISYLAGPRKKWRAEWSEVAAVERGHGELAIRLHDGQRHVLRADDHLDGHDILAETHAAIAAHAPHVPGSLLPDSRA